MNTNSSSEDKKRTRGANFSEIEKSILADIINRGDIKSVIENKSQNGPSNKEKELMWDKITVIFNANQQVRTRLSSQLKQCYVNLKRQIKSNIANDRLQKFATGSGPYSQPKTSDAELKVYEVIRSQVQSLNNPFDSDAVFHDNNEHPDEQAHMGLETYEIVLNEENSNIEPSIVENTSINNDTAHIDKALVLTDTRKAADIPPTWSKRNRPNLNKTKKSEAAKAKESISILSNKRADLIEIEKQGMIKRQLLEQELQEIKIENAKKKSKILDLNIKLLEKQNSN